jgi:hypothetical protein
LFVTLVSSLENETQSLVSWPVWHGSKEVSPSLQNEMSKVPFAISRLPTASHPPVAVSVQSTPALKLGRPPAMAWLTIKPANSAPPAKVAKIRFI